MWYWAAWRLDGVRWKPREIAVLASQRRFIQQSSGEMSAKEAWGRGPVPSPGEDARCLFQLQTLVDVHFFVTRGLIQALCNPWTPFRFAPVVGVLQAGILEWVYALLRVSSRQGWSQVSWLQMFTAEPGEWLCCGWTHTCVCWSSDKTLSFFPLSSLPRCVFELSLSSKKREWYSRIFL